MYLNRLQEDLELAASNAANGNLIGLGTWFSEAQVLLRLAIDLKDGKPPSILDRLRYNAQRFRERSETGNERIFVRCADQLQELLADDSALAVCKKSAIHLQEELVALIAKADEESHFGLASWFSEAKILLALAVDLKEGRQPLVIDMLRYRAQCLGTRSDICGTDGVCHGEIFARCSDRRYLPCSFGEKSPKCYRRACHGEIFGLCANQMELLLAVRKETKPAGPAVDELGTTPLMHVMIHMQMAAEREVVRNSVLPAYEQVRIQAQMATAVNEPTQIIPEQSPLPLAACEPMGSISSVESASKVEQSMDPVVYVDGDETLFHRQDVLSSDEKPANPNAVRLEHGGRTYFVVARPSARPFLEALQRYCRPDMVTSGATEFQTLVLETLGLRNLIGTVHGNVNNGVDSEILNPPGKAVLVDDIHPENDGARAKCRKLGRDNGVEVTHLRCCKYFGGQEDPSPLTDFLPRIAQICS